MPTVWLLGFEEVAGEAVDIEFLFNFDRNLAAFLQTRFLKLVNKTGYFYMFTCFWDPNSQFPELIGLIRRSL